MSQLVVYFIIATYVIRFYGISNTSLWQLFNQDNYPRKSIAVNSLQETELKNAFSLKVYRQEISHEESEKLLDKINKDFMSNRFTRVDFNWIRVWEAALDYSRKYAGETGCRTLDILHVAAAKILPAEAFYTNDARQKELAHRVGMEAYLSVG